MKRTLVECKELFVGISLIMIYRCAYRKAVAVVRSLPFKIEKPEDLKNVREIGQKIREKIIEIVKTGRLKKADILTVTLETHFS